LDGGLFGVGFLVSGDDFWPVTQEFFNFCGVLHTYNKNLIKKENKDDDYPDDSGYSGSKISEFDISVRNAARMLGRS